jgi:hypothetical protein
MGTTPVDPAPYAQALRAADPRLRQSPAGPLACSRPSGLDNLREARFAAYRRRPDVRPPVKVPERPRMRPDAAAEEAWHARAAAYRARLGDTQVPEPGSRAALAVQASRRGAAAAREALGRPAR